MNAVTPVVDQVADHYIAQFNAARAQLPGGSVPWLQKLRDEALTSFSSNGFPGPRDEEWKYTSLKPIHKHAFSLPASSEADIDEQQLGGELLGGLECHRMVFVNGHYQPNAASAGNLPDGLSVTSMAASLNDEPARLEPHLARYADSDANGFAALNTAFAGSGACIQIAKGIVVERPIHLVFVSTGQGDPANHYLRNLIVAGENVKACVIESYISLDESVYLNNAVTEVALAQGASVEHYKLQQESIKAFHVSTLQIQQARDSRFTSHSISLGAALARHDINSSLEAEGAQCTLNGLYVVSGRQHVDYHTRVDHRKPHGTSHEFYKGVLAGRSRSVFNGKVYVHPDAQKTDAVQSNKNLLLSPHAEADTKPQLEIYADDVKCAHGATVGQLDDRMLFYLRSRGIDKAAARGMLTYGFAHDIVERMGIAEIREQVETALMSRLPDAEFIKELI